MTGRSSRTILRSRQQSGQENCMKERIERRKDGTTKANDGKGKIVKGHEDEIALLAGEKHCRSGVISGLDCEVLRKGRMPPVEPHRSLRARPQKAGCSGR